jgi:hypothetical protein
MGISIVKSVFNFGSRSKGKEALALLQGLRTLEQAFC